MKNPTAFYCISLLAAILLFSSCGSGGRLFSNSPSEKVLVGKWKDEKNKTSIEFFDDSTGSFSGSEMKYSWLKDGKHLRFEYSKGMALIYEAEVQDNTLKIGLNDHVMVFKKEK